MSIATRINAIEEHIGNAYDKLEDLGIDLTNVDKNIDNIASLLDTVYEEYPKVTGTGTELTLDGTKVGKLGLDVKGNSTQNTTTGKNKLNLNRTETSYSTGVTLTETNFYSNLAYDGGVGAYNTQNIIDGSNIKVTSRYGQGAGFPIACNPSEKWTLSATRSDNDGNLCFVYFDENFSYLSNSGNYAVDTLTATTPSNCKWAVALFNVKGSTSKQVTFSKVMLEKASSASSFEPYTYGASPNPSYEQPILSAGDTYTQLEYIESSETQYIDTGFKPNQDTKLEIDYKYIDDGVIRHDWSAFGVNELFVLSSSNISPMLFKYNSTKYISTVSTLERHKVIFDKNNVYVDGTLIKTFTYATFQANYNALLFARRANSNGALQERSKMQLYDCKIYDNDVLIRHFIPCKRNSDNVLGLYDLINGVFYTNAGTGTFIAGTEKTGFISEKIVNKNLIGLGTQLNGYRNNNTGKMVLDSGVIGYYFPTKLLPTQITFNGINGNRANVSYYNEIPASGVDALSYTNSNTLPRTITVDKTYKYIHIQFSYNVTNVTEIQVEGNATATTYIAPAEQTYTIPCQQPMRSIGDVRDEFIKVNGSWVERHNIGRFLYVGTENIWQKDTTYNRFFIYNNVMLNTPVSTRQPILSNYFKYASSGGAVGTAFRYNDYLYFYSDSSLTLEDFKTWLSTHNLEVICELKTPTDLPCTEEQIAILENLPKSYDEQTNIYSLDITPAYVEAKALKGE